MPDDTNGPKPVPYFTFTAHPSQERVITVRLVGHTGMFALFWGDDQNDSATGNTNIVKPRAYPAPGAYTVTAKKVDGSGDIIATGQVIVRDELHPVGVTFAADPNNPEIWEATFSEVEPSEILPRIWINWGDDTTADEVWAIPGSKVRHPIKPGTYTRTVRDVGTKRVTREQFTVEAEKTPDPNGTFAKSPSATGTMTARFTISAVTASKPVMVDWGDQVSNPSEITAPKAGSYVEHTYDFGDAYMPRAYFKDGTGTPLDGFVEVPFP